jgi:hypothetical protein
VLDLFRYWKDFPPPHLALNSILVYLGAKSPGSSQTPELSDAEKQIAADTRIRPFKRLPKHVRQFLDEVNSGQIKRVG